ncbi:LOW QUALITY PROTEIN: probable plastidic glucose transporter 2 [Drosophila ficusphila]|uniref:LOW QUALITY PROTEIN: probable plastidic glucose transporter 2 n=1 Tax=Drosophila ficusphila TaxID=30025 RepID=UPI001C8A2BCF|nr:LOW QUALITY PROTEIN: probable plastidic glucose transporter 2 [Drosophila ficusphila]
MPTDRVSPDDGYHVVPIHSESDAQVPRNLNDQQVLILSQRSPCCNRDLRNQPQANAVGAAALIFLSGGIHIAWSIGFDSLLAELVVTNHVRISWFIAAIIGALLGGFFSRWFPYKVLMEFCSLLTFIGGILMAVNRMDLDALLAGRYLNGLANGLALAPTLAMAGELSVFYKRGTTTSATEQWPTTIGIFVQIVCSVVWDSQSDFTVEQFQGVISGVLGATALLLAFLLSIDSPVDLLQQGNEQGAIEALSRLQRPRAVTAETYDQVRDHRTYLDHHRSMGWRHALPALVRLSVLRIFYGLSFSVMVVFTIFYGLSFSVMVVFTLTWTSTEVYGGSSGPYVLFGLLRLVGSFSSAFALDSLGRKIPLLLGLVISGGLSFGLATRFAGSEFLKFSDSRMALWLLLIYQLFAGIAFAPSSTYLSEAFPHRIKRQCIAFCYALEMIAQLLICQVDLSAIGSDTSYIALYFFTLGGLLLAGFLFSIWYMPETKDTTLLQAQFKFQEFVIPPA